MAAPLVASPRPSARRASLAFRTTAVTIGVAALACLIAGLVSLRLVSVAAQKQEQVTLGRLADVAARGQDAAALSGLGTASATTSRPLRAARRERVALLRGTNIAEIPVTADGTAEGARAALVPATAAQAVAAGDAVTERLSLRGHAYFLAGRRFVGRAGGLVLVEPVSDVSELTTPLLRRLALALALGLAAAAAVGLVLARRLARPLAEAAGAAHRLAAGDRAVRLVPRGPAEVCEVSESLNTLAESLTTSEGRQRDFLLSVSHELRTPLTGIRGFAEALADGVTSGAEVPAAGAVIVAEANRLERLVSDLLDLARLGAQDFRIDATPVDLAALMRAASEVWSARCAAEGIAFRLDIAASPVVVTDPTRVRQIVDGLAENALRVTPAGAPLVFGLYVDAEGLAGQSAVIQVRDGGPGLTEADCAVAFERSALYDRYRGIRRVGTGVGLALVAGLTRRLGGSAHAGKAPEGGAAFTVRLPMSSAR